MPRMTSGRYLLSAIRFLFSGDVGRYNGPLYHDPAPPPECDYLICESTYGSRDHPDVDIHCDAVEVVNTAIRKTHPEPGAKFEVGEHTDIIYALQDLRAVPRRMDVGFFIWIAWMYQRLSI